MGEREQVSSDQPLSWLVNCATRDQLIQEVLKAREERDELLKERDALAAKVASYERADRDLNEALNMGDGSYRP